MRIRNKGAVVLCLSIRYIAYRPVLLGVYCIFSFSC
jgi:hypothetical protein